MKFKLVNPPCSLMANSRAAVVAWTTSSWDLPRGPVVLVAVRCAPRVPHVDLQQSVLEASETPAILVSPFIRCAERAHALRGEVRELLEQVVVDGTSAHDAHHAGHARGQLGRPI